jgi:hypothetical protein
MDFPIFYSEITKEYLTTHIHPPLRFRVVEMLHLFTVNPTPSSPTSSPANVVQDAFARNPSSITHLAGILNSSDSLQVRCQTAKIILALSQMDWKAAATTTAASNNNNRSGSGGSGGSSIISNPRVNYPAVVTALNSTVPKLLSLWEDYLFLFLEVGGFFN